jgi:hypothetical protein
MISVDDGYQEFRDANASPKYILFMLKIYQWM